MHLHGRLDLDPETSETVFRKRFLGDLTPCQRVFEALRTKVMRFFFDSSKQSEVLPYGELYNIDDLPVN